MERLVHEVSPFLWRPNYNLILVFDGGSELNRPQIFPAHGRLLIVNSLKKQPADLLIEGLVKKIGHRFGNACTISVVTDDHSLRSMVQALGGGYLSVRQFDNELRALQSIQGDRQDFRKRNGRWNPRLGDFF